MPRRSRVFKARVLCKKNFTYSGVFKPYSDVLKPYSGVFLQIFFFINTRFREPYSGIFNPYSDVLKPYSGVFLQFMEIKSLKLDFQVDFFLTLNLSSYKSRLKNSEFYLRTRVLNTWDASFQHYFEMWQLTKFFNIYCYLEKKFPKTLLNLAATLGTLSIRALLTSTASSSAPPILLSALWIAWWRRSPSRRRSRCTRRGRGRSNGSASRPSSSSAGASFSEHLQIVEVKAIQCWDLLV